MTASEYCPVEAANVMFCCWLGASALGDKAASTLSSPAMPAKRGSCARVGRDTAPRFVTLVQQREKCASSPDRGPLCKGQPPLK